MRNVWPLLCLLLLASCTREEEGSGIFILISEAPQGQGGILPDPAIRYPDGTRLVWRTPDQTASGPLSEGMAAAGGGSPSHDCERILFVGKKAPP